MLSGLSRGNKPVVLRRKQQIAGDGTWGLRGRQRDVLTLNGSTGDMVMAGTTALSPIIRPSLSQTYISIGRPATANTYVAAGVGSTRQGIGIGNTGGIHWSTVFSAGTVLDSTTFLSITCESAGVAQFGDDAATVVNQTIKACDGVGTDKAGATLTLSGGRNTGAGTEAAVLLQTAAATGTSATPNTPVTRLSATSVSVSATVPVQIPSYTVAQATAAIAIACPRGLIWVSDEAGGACPAISDGATFRKIALGATIS